MIYNKSFRRKLGIWKGETYNLEHSLLEQLNHENIPYKWLYNDGDFSDGRGVHCISFGST